jgi:hypothetical protein
MRHWLFRICAAGLTAATFTASPVAQRGAGAAPVAGVDVERLQGIDALVTHAITEGKLPGARSAAATGRRSRRRTAIARSHSSASP